MNLTFDLTDTGLSTTHKFAASPADLFAAWTQPEILKQWFAPSDAFKTPNVDVDLRVGGKYRIHMVSPDGNDHVVGGEYQKIVANEELVYTWAWESSENPPSTVTVKFTADGDGTLVDFKHEGLANADAVASHTEGWTGCLGRLENR